MAVSPWTHPIHIHLAVLGTALNGVALMFCVIAIVAAPAFSRDTDRYRYKDFSIDCNEMSNCTRKDMEAGWMVGTVSILFVGLAINLASFVVQSFLFWPMNGILHKHLAIILKAAIYVDIAGGYCKFIAGLVMIGHCPYINRSMGGFKMRTMPIGLIMLSFILEVLGSALFILTLDKGVTGGQTHKDRLEEIRNEKRMLEAERKETLVRRRSTFIPNPESTHGHVHLKK